MPKLTKQQKRKNKLQVRAKKQESFDTQLIKANKEGEARAKKAIQWIKDNGTTQLPKNFY
jgi:uncharacterized iron-regulated protein